MKKTPQEKEKEQLSLAEGLRQEQNKNVLTKFIYTSVAMVLMPIVTYFGVFMFTKSWIEEQNKRSFYAGIAAVVTVLIIMALFVVMAFFETDEEEEQAKDKKKSQ